VADVVSLDSTPPSSIPVTPITRSPIA